MPKKDESWWMCIDYMELKKITLKKKYAFPMIDDMLD